jgi:hypothetical protein
MLRPIWFFPRKIAALAFAVTLAVGAAKADVITASALAPHALEGGPAYS